MTEVWWIQNPDITGLAPDFRDLRPICGWLLAFRGILAMVYDSKST